MLCLLKNPKTIDLEGLPSQGSLFGGAAEETDEVKDLKEDKLFDLQTDLATRLDAEITLSYVGCSGNPCGDHGNCEETGEGFECDCEEGYPVQSADGECQAYSDQLASPNPNQDPSARYEYMHTQPETRDWSDGCRYRRESNERDRHRALWRLVRVRVRVMR